MTMLAITVLAAQPSPLTASPGITFRLRIEELSAARIHAVTLRCQVQISARCRRYMKDEQDRLYELFGNVSQWDRTLRNVTWGQATLVVPSFDGRIDIDLPVPCTYDLQVAAAKYLHAIRDRHVPLTFLFSGMVFQVKDGGLHMEPVPWDLEASYQMPGTLWHASMDQFFPGRGWLMLRRDTIDRLQAFRGRHAVVSWDEALDLLLEDMAAEEHV
jgi:uncharacterized protein DUF6084